VERVHPTANQLASEGVSLAQLIRCLWAYRILIMGITAASLLVAGVIFTRFTPKFVSASKFICKSNSGGNLGNLGALASLAGIQTPARGDVNPSEYFNDILFDDEFLERLLVRNWFYRQDSLSLQEIWNLQPDKSRQDWEYAYRKAAVGILRSNRRIELIKNMDNNVFTLKTRFEDAKLAKQVNDFIIESLNDYLADNLASTAREKRTFIEHRLLEIEAELKRNENSLVAFRESNRDILAPKLVVESSRLQRTLRVNEEIYLQLKKEFEMAKIEESNTTPLLEVISKATVPLAPDAGKRRAILPAGLALGFVTGSLLALILGWRKGMFS